jgi:hypothetical protein
MMKLKYGKISIDFGDWDKVEIDWIYYSKRIL